MEFVCYSRECQETITSCYGIDGMYQNQFICKNYVMSSRDKYFDELYGVLDCCLLVQYEENLLFYSLSFLIFNTKKN